MKHTMNLTSKIQVAKRWDDDFPVGTPVGITFPGQPPQRVVIASQCFLGTNLQPEVFIAGHNRSVPCDWLQRVESNEVFTTELSRPLRLPGLPAPTTE
jgi:hypothetical protein